MKHPRDMEEINILSDLDSPGFPESLNYHSLSGQISIQSASNHSDSTTNKRNIKVDNLDRDKQKNRKKRLKNTKIPPIEQSRIEEVIILVFKPYSDDNSNFAVVCFVTENKSFAYVILPESDRRHKMLVSGINMGLSRLDSLRNLPDQIWATSEKSYITILNFKQFELIPKRAKLTRLNINPADIKKIMENFPSYEQNLLSMPSNFQPSALCSQVEIKEFAHPSQPKLHALAQDYVATFLSNCQQYSSVKDPVTLLTALHTAVEKISSFTQNSSSYLPNTQQTESLSTPATSPIIFGKPSFPFNASLSSSSSSSSSSLTQNQSHVHPQYTLQPQPPTAPVAHNFSPFGLSPRFSQLEYKNPTTSSHLPSTFSPAFFASELLTTLAPSDQGINNPYNTGPSSSFTQNLSSYLRNTQQTEPLSTPTTPIVPIISGKPSFPFNASLSSSSSSSSLNPQNQSHVHPQYTLQPQPPTTPVAHNSSPFGLNPRFFQLEQTNPTTSSHLPSTFSPAFFASAVPTTPAPSDQEIDISCLDTF